MAFYNATLGGSWVTSAGWGASSDPCDPPEWYGISCDGGQVTELILRDNNLHGTLPTALGLIAPVIAIGNASLSGTLSSALGMINQLFLFQTTLSGMCTCPLTSCQLHLHPVRGWSPYTTSASCPPCI